MVELAAAAAAASAAPAAAESSFSARSALFSRLNPSFLVPRVSHLKFSPKFPPKGLSFCNTGRCYSPVFYFNSLKRRAPYCCLIVKGNCSKNDVDNSSSADNFGEVLRRGLAAASIGVVVILSCRRVLAVEGVASWGYGYWDRNLLALRSSSPKVLQVLTAFREQGLVLAALLGLSAFFSMAETSITTLWPWKVRELAEKESENGVCKMLRNDVTRFLTTILIGTTVVNIGATALVTEAATAIFGEAGISAATGVMAVCLMPPLTFILVNI